MGDYDTRAWAELFCDCNTVTNEGVTFNFWPDGLSYFEQDQLTVAVFKVLRDEITRAIKSNKAGVGSG